MKLRIACMFLLVGACTRTESTDPDSQPAVPSAPEAPPAPTAEQVPVAADFTAEASQAITPDSYLAELEAIDKQLTADEAAAPAR